MTSVSTCDHCGDVIPNEAHRYVVRYVPNSRAMHLIFPGEQPKTACSIKCLVELAKEQKR